jgi:hypothetical protein
VSKLCEHSVPVPLVDEDLPQPPPTVWTLNRLGVDGLLDINRYRLDCVGQYFQLWGHG